MSSKSKMLAFGLFLAWLAANLCFVRLEPASADDSLWEMQAARPGIESAFNAGPGAQPSAQEYAVNVIKIFLSLLALIFLIVIIWGGFRWMTAGGNDERVKKAKSNVRNGIIGFIIILCSYAILSFVYDLVQEMFFEQ